MVEEMFDELPEPQNLVEEDYQEMLRSLRHIIDDSLTSWQNERRDSIDYYTTWVHVSRKTARYAF